MCYMNACIISNYGHVPQGSVLGLFSAFPIYIDKVSQASCPASYGDDDIYQNEC